MDEQQLKRSLQSIGMACFVKYYEMFADPSVSNDTVVDVLMKKKSFLSPPAVLGSTSPDA